VLSGIAQVRPLPPLTEDAGAPAPTEVRASAPAAGGRADTPADGREPAAGGTVVPIRRRPRTAWFAAAAAAVVIAIGGLAWSPWSDDTSSQSPMARVTAAADAMTVRTSKDGATAEVAYSQQLGKAAISVTGMPPAPDGKTYQLWYVAPSGTATSAGLLGVDAEGSGQALLTGQVTPTDKVAMTMEPAGGSAQPTTDPLVVLALA